MVVRSCATAAPPSPHPHITHIRIHTLGTNTHALCKPPIGGYGNGYEELCPGGTAKSKACLKVAAWIVSPKLADQTCSPTLCAAAAKVCACAWVCVAVKAQSRWSPGASGVTAAAVDDTHHDPGRRSTAPTLGGWTASRRFTATPGTSTSGAGPCILSLFILCF